MLYSGKMAVLKQKTVSRHWVLEMGPSKYDNTHFI